MNTIQQTVSGAGENKKIASIQQEIADYHNKDNRLTTDYGVKQTNTDDWLRVASEDKTGPSLLEDHAGREKIHRFDHERIPERVVHARVCSPSGQLPHLITDNHLRVPVLLVHSSSSRAPQMSPLPVS